MWYVIQTMTGHEENLVRMIRRVLNRNDYADCFVPYYERIWRQQQTSRIHVERLFPGYVFIIAENPDEVYRQLKNVPAMSRLMSDGMFTFLPLEQEEEIFFQRLIDENHVIRLSFVEKDFRGHIRRITGPLESLENQVIRWQYKKRFALVRVHLLGIEKQVCLGIILTEDIQQEIAYGKVEAPVTVPPRYQVREFIGKSAEEEQEHLLAGDRIIVSSGPLAGMTGMVWKVKKGTVEVGIRLFGQDMPVKVPIKEIDILER